MAMFYYSHQQKLQQIKQKLKEVEPDKDAGSQVTFSSQAFNL